MGMLAGAEQMAQFAGLVLTTPGGSFTVTWTAADETDTSLASIATA